MNDPSPNDFAEQLEAIDVDSFRRFFESLYDPDEWEISWRDADANAVTFDFYASHPLSYSRPGVSGRVSRRPEPTTGEEVDDLLKRFELWDEDSAVYVSLAGFTDDARTRAGGLRNTLLMDADDLGRLLRQRYDALDEADRESLPVKPPPRDGAP